jgi:hypothetical protein
VTCTGTLRDSFTVNLAASAQTASDCATTGTHTATVTVNRLPVLSVDVLGDDFAVCSDEASYSLSYGIATGHSALLFSVYTSDVCSLAANGAAVNGETKVKVFLKPSA